MIFHEIVEFKVVPEGCWRNFFKVKVKTVKLIGGRRFLAARSGLNVRTYSKLIFRFYCVCNHLQANKLHF